MCVRGLFISLFGHLGSCCYQLLCAKFERNSCYSTQLASRPDPHVHTHARAHTCTRTRTHGSVIELDFIFHAWWLVFLLWCFCDEVFLFVLVFSWEWDPRRKTESGSSLAHFQVGVTTYPPDVCLQLICVCIWHHRTHHQKSRYVFDLFYKRKAISRGNERERERG